MTGGADQYLDALIRGDRQSAAKLADAALDAGATLQSLYLDVLEPAMREIGRLWQENAISVADEHLATAITQTVMGRAFERLYDWRERRTPTLIAACAADERHQMGLRMLCDLLELEGWDTMYLGASVPIESLVAIVEKQQPDAVALSATIAPHIPRVRDAIAAIRASQVARQPVVIVGGRALSGRAELAQQLGADMVAADAAQAVQRLQDRFARGR